MKVYHVSYMLFYISGEKIKVKEIIIKNWITAIVAFPVF